MFGVHMLVIKIRPMSPYIVPREAQHVVYMQLVQYQAHQACPVSQEHPTCVKKANRRPDAAGWTIQESQLPWHACNQPSFSDDQVYLHTKAVMYGGNMLLNARQQQV